MSETVDPITWLRDQITANRPISLNEKTGELEMENAPQNAIRIPKDAETAWKRKDGKGYYTIGSLWLMLKMRGEGAGPYRKTAHQLAIPAVEFRDSKPATEYFTAVVNESD